MTLVNKNLEEMMLEIEFKKLTFFDYWNPERFPDRVHFSGIEYDFGLDLLLVANKIYMQEIVNECEKGKALNKELLKPVLSLALENSLTRGNRNSYIFNNEEGDKICKEGIPVRCYRECYLPLSIKIFHGEKGFIIRIRDSGEGFPYTKIIAKKREGESYAQNFGKGMYVMDKEGVEVAYEGTGSTINIMFK